MSISKTASPAIQHLDPFLDSRFSITSKEPIGQGTFGSVYTGWDNQFKKFVVIKILSSAHIDSALQEWENGLHLFGHLNIPKVYGVFRQNDHIYLVQEKKTGKDLSEYLASKNNQISIEVAKYIMKQLLEVVSDMHKKEVTHRDLKPANIYLDETKDPKVCVIDLGIASNGLERLRSLTGTPAYMAPEIFHEDYTSQVDSWSLGVILYLMIRGELPFRHNMIHYLAREGNFSLTPEQIESLKEISKPAADLVTQLLHPNPDERISASEALNHEWFQQTNGRRWTLGDVSPSEKEPTERWDSYLSTKTTT